MFSHTSNWEVFDIHLYLILQNNTNNRYIFAHRQLILYVQTYITVHDLAFGTKMDKWFWAIRVKID